MLTALLSEINSLGKDYSASLVLDLELRVGSSLGEIVLVSKANPPQGRFWSQNSISEPPADEIEISEILVFG